MAFTLDLAHNNWQWLLDMSADSGGPKEPVLDGVEISHGKGNFGDYSAQRKSIGSPCCPIRCKKDHSIRQASSSLEGVTSNFSRRKKFAPLRDAACRQNSLTRLLVITWGRGLYFLSFSLSCSTMPFYIPLKHYGNVGTLNPYSPVLSKILLNPTNMRDKLPFVNKFIFYRLQPSAFNNWFIALEDKFSLLDTIRYI